MFRHILERRRDNGYRKNKTMKKALTVLLVILCLSILASLVSGCTLSTSTITSTSTMTSTQSTILTYTTTSNPTTKVSAPKNLKLKIMFTSDGKMYSMEADCSRRIQIPNYDGGCSDPNWSSDGSKITFISNGDVFVMNTDSSQKTKLTQNGNSSKPSISPDGSRVAFLLGSPSKNPGYSTRRVYVVNSDGSNEHQLVSNDDLNSLGIVPAWSPDGSRIAFATGWVKSNIAMSDICVAMVDGSKQYIISPHNGIYYFYSWSAGGSLVAFHDGNNIYISNSDGSNLKRINDSSLVQIVGDMQLVWSPSGTSIIYAANDANIHNNNLYVVGTDGSNRKQITNYSDDSHWSSGYFYAEWYSDGSKIIGVFYHSNNSLVEVFAMNADGSNQTKLTELFCDNIQIVWSY